MEKTYAWIYGEYLAKHGPRTTRVSVPHGPSANGKARKTRKPARKRRPAGRKRRPAMAR